MTLTCSALPVGEAKPLISRIQPLTDPRRDVEQFKESPTIMTAPQSTSELAQITRQPNTAADATVAALEQAVLSGQNTATPLNGSTAPLNNATVPLNNTAAPLDSTAIPLDKTTLGAVPVTQSALFGNLPITPPPVTSTLQGPPTAQLIQDILLKPQGGTLPWPYHKQCYNDHVYACHTALAQEQRYLDIHPQQAETSYRSFNGILPIDPHQYTFYAMKMLLGGQVPVFPSLTIPINTFMALEMLLGMGFQPATETSIPRRTINLQPWLPIRGQLNSLAPIIRLGLYRLLEALLQQGEITFNDGDSELLSLLAYAREQPFSLAILLKRVISLTLRQSVSLKCPGCNLLAESIHRCLSVPLETRPLCSSGGQSIQPLYTNFLNRNGRKLDRHDQVMLARAFLYLVLDVPFSATICSDCASPTVPRVRTTTLINAMLKCHCLPHSRVVVIN